MAHRGRVRGPHAFSAKHPVLEYTRRIAAGNDNLTASELTEVNATITKLMTYFRGPNSELFVHCPDPYVASYITLLATSLQRCGPAAPDMGEEVRSCYRKLRSNLHAHLTSYLLTFTAPSISPRYQLLLHLTLRTDILRGYTSLLFKLAAALQERQSRRAIEAVREALAEVNALMLGLTSVPESVPWDSTHQQASSSASASPSTSCSGTSPQCQQQQQQPPARFSSPAEYFPALSCEVNHSKLLDAWSLCFLQFNKCEDVARQAAELLTGFALCMTHLLAGADTMPYCRHLLMSAPRLQYLTAVHFVRFLDLLDGGGVCGLPNEAPDVPLFGRDGDLLHANRAGEASIGLVSCTLAIWFGALYGALETYVLADADGADARPQSSAFGIELPRPMQGRELQEWLLSQLDGRGGGERGVPPLHLRATLAMCVRAARAAVGCLQAIAAAAPRRRLSAPASVQLFNDAVACANACMSFIQTTPGEPNPLAMRPADIAYVRELWDLYVLAVETALWEPHLPAPQPQQQQRRHEQQRSQPRRGDEDAAGPGLGRAWVQLLDSYPHTYTQSSAEGCTSHFGRITAEAAHDAALLYMLEGLVRRSYFYVFKNPLPWTQILMFGMPLKITSLFVSAGKAMRRLTMRPRRQSEGLSRLKKLTEPLAWMEMVVDVESLRIAAGSARCTAGGCGFGATGVGGGADGTGAGAAAGAVGGGADWSSACGAAAVGAVRDCDSDARGGSGGSNTDGTDNGGRGPSVGCSSCGEDHTQAPLPPALVQLASLFTFAAAYMLGPASLLCRQAVELLCGMRPCGELAKELEEAAADTLGRASALLGWCQLLLTAHMDAVQVAARPQSSSAAAASTSTATAAPAAAAGAASKPSLSSAAASSSQWRDLLLGEVDLFGLLAACADLLRDKVVVSLADEEALKRLTGAFRETLRLAHGAFPAALRQELMSKPRRIPVAQKLADAPLGFGALLGLLGPDGLCVDAELLCQLATLMRHCADPRVAFGTDGTEDQPAAVEGVASRFRAAAALLQPPARLPQLLPQGICANPVCVNLAGRSESLMPQVHCDAGGGGCCDTRYCSQDCRAMHWAAEHWQQCGKSSGA